jgi:hypothetical protein
LYLTEANFLGSRTSPAVGEDVIDDDRRMSLMMSLMTKMSLMKELSVPSPVVEPSITLFLKFQGIQWQQFL